MHLTACKWRRVVPSNKLEVLQFRPGTESEQAKQQVSTVVSLKDFSTRSKVSSFPGSRLWNSHCVHLSSLAESPALTSAQLITSSSTRPRSKALICCGPPDSEIRLPCACNLARQHAFRRPHRGPVVPYKLIFHPRWQLLAAQPFRCTLEAFPNPVCVSLSTLLR